MNDFTKDELNTLQDCIWHILHCDKMYISCEAEKGLDIIMNKISTMNNFTKEELEMICLDMNYNILKYGALNVASEYLDLRDKVESMIDNYGDDHNNE